MYVYTHTHTHIRTHTHATNAHTCHIHICTVTFRNQVKAKCAGVLQALGGQALRAAWGAWRDLCVRKRRAVLRWGSAALVAAFARWREVYLWICV